jgi:hypothetical protein
VNRQGPIRTRIGNRLGPRGRAPREAAATWRIEGDSEVAWIKLDDKFWHHPKIRALVPEHRVRCGAFYVASICFGSLYENDGLVRLEDLPMLIPPDTPPDPAEIAELVRVRLWEVAEYRDVAGDKSATRQGWRVHDFLAHNMSAQARADLRKEKTADRQRQRRRRKRKDRPNPDVAEMSPATISVSPNVAPLETRDQRLETREREKRLDPPLAPPLATHVPETATGSAPSFSLSVKNPDRPEPDATPEPQETTAMPDADAESRERQWQDAQRQRELRKLAEFAERHGHPEVAAQIREQAKVRRPLSGPPPKPDSPDPDTVAAILARSAQRWEAFFACTRRKHPGHSDQTCPEKPPSPARAADAQARAEFGPGADDPVDEAAP